MENKSKSIGALWINESKKGVKYMLGSVEINGEITKIVIFKNNYKETDRHPDYRIFISEELKNEVVKDEDDLPF